ncbi:hypothetical protein Lsai_2510 [Legionella sainthelensi]|uniref:Uncharacterized protein n=1 Tax=Legionella sainthelensi TaxID=28087 RepID=A0A0W0YE81_9GAMM|nr:hypothetical protein [Legionella sainthelensi]KTD54918.1 hypothetical protein Lsai_2510 [Legionella sainthelensi]VEH37340.1 Uncharacterised protein [Legionella sainthelensi]
MKLNDHEEVITPKLPRKIASDVKVFIVCLANYRVIPGKLAECLIRWLGLRHE